MVAEERFQRAMEAEKEKQKTTQASQQDEKKKAYEKELLGKTITSSEEEGSIKGKVVRVEQRRVGRGRKKRLYWGVWVRYDDGDEIWYKVGDVRSNK